jgi:RNA polymerase sigma-70 factor (ECF subfamily)
MVIEQVTGKVQSFRAFYEENLGPISRSVYHKVGQWEEAEDLTTLIFLKVLREVQINSSVLSSQAWLFQVARTTIADYWRASSRRLSTTSLDALLASGWERAIETEQRASPSKATGRVQRLLQALPARQHEVLACRFLLPLSMRETARKMGITEANVKMLQHRALKRAADLDEQGTGTMEED